MSTEMEFICQSMFCLHCSYKANIANVMKDQVIQNICIVYMWLSAKVKKQTSPNMFWLMTCSDKSYKINSTHSLLTLYD